MTGVLPPRRAQAQDLQVLGWGLGTVARGRLPIRNSYNGRRPVHSRDGFSLLVKISFGVRLEQVQTTRKIPSRKVAASIWVTFCIE